MLTARNRPGATRLNWFRVSDRTFKPFCFLLHPQKIGLNGLRLTSLKKWFEKTHSGLSEQILSHLSTGVETLGDKVGDDEPLLPEAQISETRCDVCWGEDFIMECFPMDIWTCILLLDVSVCMALLDSVNYILWTDYFDPKFEDSLSRSRMMISLQLLFRRLW